MEKKKLTSKEEAVKHLSHINTTWGIDLDNPFYFIKSDYSIKGFYLNNLFFELNTRVFDVKIDDLKGSDKE